MRYGPSYPFLLTISYHYAALEHIPSSVHLCKEVVNLETSPADARTLISRAVEVIPLLSSSVGLSRFLRCRRTPMRSPTKCAKAVSTSRDQDRPRASNRARNVRSLHVRREREAQARRKTLVATVRALLAHCVPLTRDQWLKEAE